MTLGGFPELLLSENERTARRLRRERLDRVFREDIRDLENIRNLSLVRIFLDALRSRVGMPIALANLANELEISPITAKRWLDLLERMYVVFTVWPLSKGLPRSLPCSQGTGGLRSNGDPGLGDGGTFIPGLRSWRYSGP
jgi:uncharacterized protein